MGSEAMSQGVGGGFRVDTDAQCVAFDQFPDRFTAESLSRSRDDQPWGCFGVSVFDQGNPRGVEVQSNGFDGTLSQGDHPLFASFAVSQTVALIEEDVGKEHIGDFRDAATRGVEEFEDSAIAYP